MKSLKSKKGFTLIELLVVIGILAVLAAIAIPSVAGLIDRANVSSDATNANEMTNAVERFVSEYELYVQDISSGRLDTENLDAAQGRVYNVTNVIDRAGIETLEKDATAGTDTTGRAIYRDTKYPVNAETMQAVVENYTKTSSSTFTPKQSDQHFWYSPDCGIVVYAKPDANVVIDLNSQIQSGKDAKGKDLSSSTQWIDLTTGSVSNGSSDTEQERDEVSNLCYDQPYKGFVSALWSSSENCFVYFHDNGTYDLYIPIVNGIQSGTYSVSENTVLMSLLGQSIDFEISNEGNTISCAVLAASLTLSPNDQDICFDGDYLYIYKSEWNGFCVQPINPTGKSSYGIIKKNINGRPVNSIVTDAFAENNLITALPQFENGFVMYEHADNGEAMFQRCGNLKNVIIPDCYTVLTQNMFMGTSMDSVYIPLSVTRAYQQALNTNIGEIRFEGTMAQWNERNLSIAFADYEGIIHGNRTVICSDGILNV